MKGCAPQMPCQYRYETKVHSRSSHTPQQYGLRHCPFGKGRSHAAQINTLRLSAARCSHGMHSQGTAQHAADQARAAATTERHPVASAASAAVNLTQRLVWASAALTLASFAPDIVAGTGGAPPQIAGAGWRPWLASLHGAFAFTTLTVVFSEDCELPAVAVHAVGAACCLALLWQASAAGQMPVLPLQLSLAAAVTSAGVNAQHFWGRSHMQLSDSAAQHLRQWLRFLGCIGMGLLAQAATGRVGDVGLAALLTAGVTWAVNSRAERSAASEQAPLLAAANWQQEGSVPMSGQWATAQRLWGNWPALSATLLLMLDAAAPLMDPAAAGASAALLPTLLAIAANALLIPRALAIPNMMFLTAVRVGFVTLSMVLLSYIGWVRRLHSRVCTRAKSSSTDSSSTL